MAAKSNVTKTVIAKTEVMKNNETEAKKADATQNKP